MIHQLLELKRRLFVLDTETTGTDPRRDRIVELGFQQWGPEGLVTEWRSLINPQCQIPESATRVHGITNAMMAGCRLCGRMPVEHPTPAGVLGDGETPCEEFKPVPTFAQVAKRLAGGFSDCDFAGQNVRFDLQITSAEMARAGVPWGYLHARVIDSARLEQIAVPRSLSHLHERYTGRKHDGAHGALSDVRAAATVIALQLQAHDALPRDLDALHKLQWPGWIDGSGKFRFVAGVPCFTQWGKYANQPMTKADVGYWDFILREDFPVDVKQIAAEAKLGRFPIEGRQAQ